MFISSLRKKTLTAFAFNYLLGCNSDEKRSKDCQNRSRCEKRFYSGGRTRVFCLCEVDPYTAYTGVRCEIQLSVRMYFGR